MAKRYVNVNYQCYEVCTVNGETGAEELYDLREWFKRMQKKEIAEKNLVVNGIRGRLEDICCEDDYGYYGLCFMRLDELSNTYKASETKPAEHIDLNDDEYIGRSTVALYDPNLHVLMVQSNRGGYGVTSIENYIQMSVDSENKFCFLRPILSAFEIEKCIKNNVTKLDVRFSNIRTVEVTNSREFGEIIENFKKLEGVTAHLELGLGYSGIDSLNNETIYEVVQDITRNKESISTAKIKLNDDAKSTLFDIFDTIEHEKITFPLERGKELAFLFMFSHMVEKYRKGARNRIAALR